MRSGITTRNIHAKIVAVHSRPRWPAPARDAWLTDVLRERGDLSNGRVESFQVEARNTLISIVGRVRPAYSSKGDAATRSPFFETRARDVGRAIHQPGRCEEFPRGIPAPVCPQDELVDIGFFHRPLVILGKSGTADHAVRAYASRSVRHHLLSS